MAGVAGVEGHLRPPGSCSALFWDSAGADADVGDATVLFVEEASDDVFEETELPVPRRMSCLIGDVRREGDRGPDDQLNSGEIGVETEDVGVAHGKVDEGSWYSFRTTTRVMCKALRDSLFEAYSRACVRCGGRFCESRMEGPASRGEDMLCFKSDDMVVLCSVVWCSIVQYSTVRFRGCNNYPPNQ